MSIIEMSESGKLQRFKPK